MVLRRPNACAEDYQNHMRWKIPDWNPSKIAVGLALQERNAALTALEASLRAKPSKLQNQKGELVIGGIGTEKAILCVVGTR